MTIRTRVLLVILLAGAASVGALYAQVQKKPGITYPTGYRKWTHVKTMVIWGKDHSLFSKFEGLHNIYINDVGWPSLQQGRAYPDGTIFVFDLYTNRNTPGAIEAGGRKFLAVMKKNAKLYADTGGWGFEVFQGYQGTGSLKNMKECFACHASRKIKDYVFSDYVE